MKTLTAGIEKKCLISLVYYMSNERFVIFSEVREMLASFNNQV